MPSAGPPLAAVALLLFCAIAPATPREPPPPQNPTATAEALPLPPPPAPPPPPDPRVLRHSGTAAAVREAAVAAGFDPTLLLAIAVAESGLRVEARSRRSSATGTMQFTETTWLAAVERFGPGMPRLEGAARRLAALKTREAALARRHPAPRGNRAEAAALRRDAAALRREAAATRRAVLALRRDPHLSAAVAAALAREDAGRFAALTRRQPSGPAEVYALHLLGVTAAAELARAAREQPDRRVDRILPPAVLRANREVFLGERRVPVSARAAMERIAARIALAPHDAEPGGVQVAEAEDPR